MPKFQLGVRPVLRCKCGKVRGMDEADARRICRHVAKKKQHHNAVRYYQCSFGGWHWTRMLDKNVVKALQVSRVCGADDCEKTFSSPPGDNAATYCSAACKRRALRHRKKAREAARRPCGFCGELYDPVDEKQKYCTPKCRGDHTLQKYYEKHPITPKTIAKMLGEA